MSRDVVVPAGRQALYERNRYSPAIRSNGFLFVSGQVGSLPDGAPHADLEAQVDMKAYQGMSLTAQQTTNALNGYLQQYQAIVADVKKGNTLDGDDYGQITEMRSKLPALIDAYDGDMMGSITDPGSAYWRMVRELKQVFDPDNIIAPGRYNLA